MKFRTLFAAAIIGAAGLSPAIAADEPQVVRQEMMKKVGGATGAMAKMVKGEADFDAAAALAALTTMSEVAATYGDCFPKGRKPAWKPKPRLRSGRTALVSMQPSPSSRPPLTPALQPLPPISTGSRPCSDRSPRTVVPATKSIA
jgi:hypothetical protein